MIDVSKDITFTTARSGGKGGQNVNKVETMVEGWLHINSSVILNDEEKEIITEKLINKITKSGFLLVKSSTDRSQIGNKEIVIKKINTLINNALIKRKKRKATKPSASAVTKRLQVKKEKSFIKEARKKVTSHHE